MHQGPHSTFHALITAALKSNDLESAIENIKYCSPENAQEIYELIFKDLFNGTFYYLKDIKTLKPELWLAFLNRNDLCSKIGAKKLRKILKSIIPIHQKLQDELAYDPKLAVLLSTYNEIFRLIVTNKDFLEALVQKKYFLGLENKEYILSQLQIMPDIDDQVLFFYENNESNDTTETEEVDEADDDLFLPTQEDEDDDNDSQQLNAKKGPTFDELKDPNTRRKTSFVEYLKSTYQDDEIKDFILSNQDGFLLSLDPTSINEYIFKTSTFSPQEKLVILKTLIANLESTNALMRIRAKNCLHYLLSKNKEVRLLFSHDLLNSLNTHALLLLSVCSVQALDPQAQTSQNMLETMKACFVPLGRAMRECLVKGNVDVIKEFFKHQQHLDMLCTLYSYCAQEECHQSWNTFWELNNITGDYQVIYNTCLRHYPHFLYRKALGHLALSKNDELNHNLAKEYLKEAIEHQYIPAYLALAALYARKNKHNSMRNMFSTFMKSQKDNQEIPRKTTDTYRFLFEIYYTYFHQIPSQLEELRGELNRLYPGLVEKFEQAMCQKVMVQKPKVLGNDLRDPINMLRRRFELLRINTHAVAPVEDPMVPAPVLVFAEQPIPPFVMQNAPYYVAPTVDAAPAPAPAAGFAPSLPMPGSPTGRTKEN
ncbi:MAG: hypothetical protein JSR17_10380 [Proteobacteria bacterium]|nr:hypothetical protein [Pseudomonadota bacterium]